MIDLEETIQQLGGRGLSGALVYTGVRAIGQLRDEVAGKSDGTIGFQVNGRRGYKWFITVTLEFNDTYTVKLLARRGRVPFTEFDKRTDVYCDELKEVFESMYDRGIQQHAEGFIPIR